MRTQTIYFDEIISVPDGEGGFTGQPSEVYSCQAEYDTLKPSRLLEANQTRLQQGYVFRIWIDSSFEPKPGTIIRFLDERLTIQGYRYYDSARTRYEITALEAAKS